MIDFGSAFVFCLAQPADSTFDERKYIVIIVGLLIIITVICSCKC